MSKFRKKGGRKMAALSTASLPDIVFMLLFFFMSVTSMKETDYKVKIKLPQATEVKKLEKKSLVSYIYVGTPLAAHQAKYGSEPYSVE
jgi:biopolymer transport protein ExbD